MNIPLELHYTEDDEWLRLEDEKTAVIGVTDFAQNSLSDIVYVELPDEGDTFDQGDTFGTVESVKAAADLLMPVSGTILAVNENLIDAPETINEDPYGDGWMIRIELSDPNQVKDLLDAQAYQASIESRE